MTFPLATYTAENGLAWFYDRSAIAFAELDRCRRMLGPLPRFDSGDKGYEGVAAVGRRIYLVRCDRAEAWDFRGRDSVYLTVTWINRDKVDEFYLNAILSSDGMCKQSHDYTHSFELTGSDTHRGEAIAAGIDLSRTQEDVYIRRDFGAQTPTVRIEKKGEDKVTEAEKFFAHGDKSMPVVKDEVESPTPAKKQPTQAIEYSIAARFIGVILFVCLILLGTYLARISGHALLGCIAGAAGFGLLRVLWHVRR